MFHGGAFWCAGNGDGPAMGQERIQRIKPITQPAFDMINRVDQARIHFDLTSAQNTDAARFTDPCFVVAINIGAHGQFRLILGRIQQCANVFGIFNRIATTRNRARDRAGFNALPVDPNIHFRRCANQVFAVAKINQEAIGCGVAAFQAAENFRWFGGARGAENAAWHNFEQFTAGKTWFGFINNGGVFARFHVVFNHIIRPARWRMRL